MFCIDSSLSGEPTFLSVEVAISFYAFIQEDAKVVPFINVKYKGTFSIRVPWLQDKRGEQNTRYFRYDSDCQFKYCLFVPLKCRKYEEVYKEGVQEVSTLRKDHEMRVSDCSCTVHQ